MSAYPVYNDLDITKAIFKSADSVLGLGHTMEISPSMGSEDFSHYLTKKPGVFFRLGTRNEEKGCTTLPHNDNFMIDEDALVSGSNTCVQFVLDNMNGIEFKIMGQ